MKQVSKLAIALILGFGLYAASSANAQLAQPEEAAAEEAMRVVSGAEVPSYYVVSAFLRRAGIVFESPADRRPTFFEEYGCAPGSDRYEACTKLIEKAAAAVQHKIEAETPKENQAGLDAKAKEVGQIYAELLNLVGKKPEDAKGFHGHVEEVRLTVGMLLSDEPGQDLLQSARVFDQELKKGFKEAASLPGYVSTPPLQ